jgi:hypothetical protein
VPGDRDDGPHEEDGAGRDRLAVPAEAREAAGLRRDVAVRWETAMISDWTATTAITLPA